MILTSPANPLLKDVRKSIARGTLTEDGYCVAESFHLLEEALRSDCAIKAVLVAESVKSAVEGHVGRLKDVRVMVVADALFASLSTTESSQGVIALVRPPTWALEQLFPGQSLIVVLDGLQDPGNVGAVVRAAEAFCATGVMFVEGACNPYNPKALRASAGSMFRVPLVAGLDGELARAALQQHKLDIYAASASGKKFLPEVDLTRRCAIVIGSEGHGVGEKLRSASLDLRIPTERVESLNAAVAAGILLYEARRQRTHKG